MKIRLILAMVICAAMILYGCDDNKKQKSNTSKEEALTQEQEKETVSSEKVELENDDKKTDQTVTDTPPVPETPDEKEDETEIKEPQPSFVNPLTGSPIDRDLTNVRPVAIMLNNLYEALPQIGISEAEIIYEVLEEGGITRLLGVYNDFYLMNEIGSVRSARDYYIDIADAHDAVFVHAGRSTYADTALRQRGTNNIDGLYSGIFYRSWERMQTKAYEHTLMTTGYGIYTEMRNMGYRTTSEKPSPLQFSKDYKTGTASANHIEIPFTMYGSKPYITAVLDYDEKTGTYLKSQFGQKHIDGDDGAQLTFKNVITLTCPMNIISGDPLGCIQVHFTGSGKGTYSVDGTTREITWSKPSRSSAYTLCEADGSPLYVAPGKSYIAIVSPGTNMITN